MTRKLPIFLSIVFFLMTFYLADAQNVKVKIYNKTGYDIDSLIVGNKFIGHISKDSATFFLNFKNFHFDTGIPLESLKGIIQGETLKHSDWGWCGAQDSTKTEGEFIFDLSIKYYTLSSSTHKEGEKYLYLFNYE